MERKRIEKLVALLLIGILMPVSLFPFPIKADTFEWYHVTGELMSSQLNNELTINNTKVFEYLFNYQYHVKFDDAYLGYTQISITQEYYDDTDNNGNISVNTLKTYTTPVKTYYVNSDEVVVNLSLKVRISAAHIQTNYDPCKNFTPSVSVSNANVTKIGLLTSIDQVIDILSDIYISVDDIEGLSTNQLTELENIVSNTSLANQYLQIISELRDYKFPIESLKFVSQCYSYNYNYVTDVFNNSYYKYPVFDLPTNRTILNISTYTALNSYLILMCPHITMSNINNYFEFQNANILDITQITNIGYSKSGTYYCFKITFRATSSSFVVVKTTSNVKIIPISFSTDRYSNYSTDFALLYGFSNPLLDNIQLIANGTSQSQSASGSLDQTTSQFSDDANDLVTIEESFNNSMNQSLQNVNPTFNMGSSFLTSANWVSQQFNRIVNNTPFASLITFGLTLGLGLLIIGKVRK